MSDQEDVYPCAQLRRPGLQFAISRQSRLTGTILSDDPGLNWITSSPYVNLTL